MNSSPGYYRSPTLYQDMIVFVSENDLFVDSKMFGNCLMIKKIAGLL